MKKKLLIILTGFSIGLSAQTPVLVNKGGLISIGNGSDTKTILFVSGDLKVDGAGVFQQNGKTVITGNLIANVTQGNVFINGSKSLFQFQNLGTPQFIKGTMGKGIGSYINFGDVLIDNSGSVTLDANMAATVQKLNLLKGRFILDSKVVSSTSAETAHLLVSEVTYSRNPAVAKENRGIVQVNLAVGDNYLNGRLIGFTPPFKSIYADYFFYNFLSRPTPKGLMGESSNLITNPLYKLEAGKGYLVGQGFVPFTNTAYYQDVNKNWSGTDYNKRATTMYSFAREFAEPTFTKFADKTDAETSEALNVDNVTVTLNEGWNYLGNPFTAPLDMTSLLNDYSGNNDDWGVSRSASSQNVDIKTSVYVLTGGQGSYNPQSTYSPFTLNASYLLAQKVGSTIEMVDKDGKKAVNQFLIAPMQMFVIGVYSGGNNKNFIIPKNKRTHGDVKFFKSTTANDEIVDELLIEVNDATSKGLDRLTVVFRDGATLNSNDKYDAPKLFSQSKAISQIYTMSSDDKKMTANIISPKTESLVMCLKPGDKTQKVSLTTARLETLKSVNNVVLEDKQTGKKIDLMSTNKYEFTSSPTDKEDRFVLRFTKNTTGIEDLISDSDLALYYADGNLKVSGLLNSDEGSIISVIDIFGRQVSQTIVNETPQVDIPLQLSQGAYIIKLSGHRSYATKILVK